MSERLMAQRQRLELDLKEFANQKEQVAAELKTLTTERDGTSAENAKLKQETRRLKTETAKLEQTLALVPLQADLNRVIELASRTTTLVDVQKIINVTLVSKFLEAIGVRGKLGSPAIKPR
jgi:uncharacterized protein (DUF3084 family)